MLQRDNTIAAVKGMAIILMVAGHAEGPWWLTNFIYLFHMPVFFIAAGYFFSEKYLDQPWDYVKKRFKGLYLPFVTWALFFLVIHNLLFRLGILNEQYGNWSGGVTHPYSWHAIAQRGVNIVFSMGGYDEFMAGAFWFFRALLLTALIYLALRLVLRHISPRFNSPIMASATICGLALAFTALKIGCHLSICTVVQGGIRECWGLLFFSAGCLIHNTPNRWRLAHWQAGVILIVLLIGTYYRWAGMNLTPKLIDVLTLPMTGIGGFLFLRHLAIHLTPLVSWLHGALIHCGLSTLYIYIFHIAAFKVVSAIKILLFHMDRGQIGCHMVIHDGAPGDGFWILYTMAGVGLPLIGLWLYKKYAASHIVNTIIEPASLRK